MAKPGVPDLTRLHIPFSPPCRGAAAAGDGFPYAVLAPPDTLVMLDDSKGNPHKPPKPDTGKDKPYVGETPYIPPPQVPGGQGSTASDQGPGTGGTTDPPAPPVVVEPPAAGGGALGCRAALLRRRRRAAGQRRH